MKKIIFFLSLLALFYNGKAEVNGCNFGPTNTLIVGATHSYTLGQGNWGPRKYTWTWGDGSANSISYSNPNNITFSSHTYSANGTYSIYISSCDSASGAGQTCFNGFTINVTGAVNTGIFENTSLNKTQIYPNPFADEIVIENGDFNKIEVRNCLGEAVISESFSNMGHCKLNTSSLCSGIYFICVLRDRKLVCIFKTYK